jgi:peroxiredoxin
MRKGLASHAMGLMLSQPLFLGKNRAGRMALVAENSVVTQLYIEEPGAFSVSAAEYVMDRL